MSETHFYEPLQGHGLPHDPFEAIVAPRAFLRDGLFDLVAAGTIAPAGRQEWRSLLRDRTRGTT